MQQGGYGGGGGGYGGGGSGGDYGNDLSGAMHHAQQDAGDSGDSSIFSSVLSRLSQNQNQYANEDFDEQDSVKAHQAMYGGGGMGQQHDAGTVGTAAAMQALKMFTGGGGGQSGHGSQGGGNSQSQFVGMAMAQASKLYDGQAAQGNVVSILVEVSVQLTKDSSLTPCLPQSQNANKQDAITKAGEMALKMYMNSNKQGGGGGGGPGGLLGMASKLLQ